MDGFQVELKKNIFFYTLNQTDQTKAGTLRVISHMGLFWCPSISVHRPILI